ncbi:MAG: hypothetical protein AB1772_06075 [Candidatus Zixiibacteriota bacterium]
MKAGATTRFLVVILIGLYFLLLTPFHAAHLTIDIHSCAQAGQGCDSNCVKHHHHSEYCPTCQLGNGTIDLPSTNFRVAVFVPVGRLHTLVDDSQPDSWNFSPTSRAPPAVFQGSIAA